jgi:hypothetical protein
MYQVLHITRAVLDSPEKKILCTCSKNGKTTTTLWMVDIIWPRMTQTILVMSGTYTLDNYSTIPHLFTDNLSLLHAWLYFLDRWSEGVRVG